MKRTKYPEFVAAIRGYIVRKVVAFLLVSAGIFMKIEKSEYVVRYTTIKLSGRIDVVNVKTLRSRLQALVPSGAAYVVLDLEDVTLLDTAGLAVLICLLKRARNAGGDVKLVWPALEGARRILKLTGFDRIFTMIDSAEIGLPSGATPIAPTMHPAIYQTDSPRAFQPNRDLCLPDWS